MQNKAFVQVGNIITYSQNLEQELQKLGLKIKHHEDNIKLLKTQINKIDESILDVQVTLGKYHSSNVAEEAQCANHQQTEEQTVECILKQDKTAAAIVCSMKNHQAVQSSKLPLTKDVLGVVATLGKVNDDNISRLLAEYVGLETMLAIVCKTYESVIALEVYDKNGIVDKNAGLHGLGPFVGRILDGRFLVICLENLRTYSGEFVADDPQRRLALLTPRLPSGECPPGFLGFAVNMIHVNPKYLSCVTANGHGLRETLFYSLFSHLQVYRTRAEMLCAIPCINDGAISLDGGTIKRAGFFSLGDREEVKVRFPINSGVPNVPVNIIETEEELKLLRWKKERHCEDVQREEALLSRARVMHNLKKEELVQHLRQSSRYMAQVLTELELYKHTTSIDMPSNLIAWKHMSLAPQLLLQDSHQKYSSIAVPSSIADSILSKLRILLLILGRPKFRRVRIENPMLISVIFSGWLIHTSPIWSVLTTLLMGRRIPFSFHGAMLLTISCIEVLPPYLSLDFGGGDSASSDYHIGEQLQLRSV